MSSIYFVNATSSSSESHMVVRASDPRRAAAIYLHAGSVLGAIDVDLSALGGDREIGVIEVPSPTGTSRDFGCLRPVSYPVLDIARSDSSDDISLEDFVEPEFPEGPTVIMLVTLDGPSGERNRLVEARSAGEAKDLAVSADGDEVRLVLINRMPVEHGPEGLVEWDEVLEMEPEFSLQP